MARIPAKKREKAFRLRMERRTFAAISEEIGVSAKTLARWEKGWVDAKGKKHPGWKGELEKAWREKSDAELQYGLIVKEERLRTYEELARMAVNKIKESFPHINAKTASDVKALISEVRELLKMLAKEKGEWSPNPQTVVAVKTDISFGELRERYLEAQVVEVADAPAMCGGENVDEDASEMAEEKERLDGRESDDDADDA